MVSVPASLACSEESEEGADLTSSQTSLQRVSLERRAEDSSSAIMLSLGKDRRREAMMRACAAKSAVVTGEASDLEIEEEL